MIVDPIEQHVEQETVRMSVNCYVSGESGGECGSALYSAKSKKCELLKQVLCDLIVTLWPVTTF